MFGVDDMDIGNAILTLLFYLSSCSSSHLKGYPTDGDFVCIWTDWWVDWLINQL